MEKRVPDPLEIRKFWLFAIANGTLIALYSVLSVADFLSDTYDVPGALHAILGTTIGGLSAYVVKKWNQTNGQE